MDLTGGQRAVVAHRGGPARVVGGFVSGKTTALAARVDSLAAEAGPERLLAIVQTGGAAETFARRVKTDGVEVTTFWGLAQAILGRHGRPVEVIGYHQRRALVAELLTAEGTKQWPTLHRQLVEPGFAEELADVVCHYQASFLGLEEIRTHARAADVPERWEELAEFTERYRQALADKGVADWAGLLIDAVLLLRDDEVLAAERGRFDHLVVDDFEATSFATHRLLTMLTGPGADVVVAGNPAGPTNPRFAGSAAFLDAFTRRFDASVDIRLEEQFHPALVRAVVLCGEPEEEPETVAAELAEIHDDGVPWDDMAVVVCRWESDSPTVFAALSAAGVPAVAGQGPDPWDDPVPPADEAVTVVSIDGAVGREWPTVVLTGCVDGILPSEHKQHRWFDRALLMHGPDVPDDKTRITEWMTSERARFDLASSRAAHRLVLVAAPPKGGVVSRFLEGVRDSSNSPQ